MAREITERQRRFVDAYMGPAKGNCAEAARIVGFKGTDKRLSAIGRKMLSAKNVRAQIDKIVAKDPAIANRNERQHFWSTTMRDPQSSMTDRLRASELLGKSQADFTERREVRQTNVQEIADLSTKELMRIAKPGDAEDDEILQDIANGKGEN